MNMTLLNEGIIVTLLGMGTVFFFLTLMIYAMDLTEKVLQFVGKYFPEELPVAATSSNKNKQEKSDEEIAVAIACAVRGSTN